MDKFGGAVRRQNISSDMENYLVWMLRSFPTTGHRRLAGILGLSRSTVWRVAQKHGIKQTTRAIAERKV